MSDVPVVDARTDYYNLPLPYTTNRLEIDVLRLMEILNELTDLLYHSRVISMTDLTERRGIIDGWFGIGSKPLILTSADSILTLQNVQATYFATNPQDGPIEEFVGWIKTECTESGQLYVEATELVGSKYFRVKVDGEWDDWEVIHTSVTQVSLGATIDAALGSLGLSRVNERLDAIEDIIGEGGGSEGDTNRVVPIHNAGVLAAGATVEIDILKHMDSTLTCTGTTAGTVRFTNLPDTTNGSVIWYLELIRGGTRLPVFTAEGKTFVWQGGTAPTLSTSATGYDQIMFENKLGRTKIECMLIKAGTV